LIHYPLINTRREHRAEFGRADQEPNCLIRIQTRHPPPVTYEIWGSSKQGAASIINDIEEDPFKTNTQKWQLHVFQPPFSYGPLDHQSPAPLDNSELSLVPHESSCLLSRSRLLILGSTRRNRRLLLLLARSTLLTMYVYLSPPSIHTLP
jgi:hypothetical protein